MRTWHVRDSALASASVSPALLTRHRAPQGMVPLGLRAFCEDGPAQFQSAIGNRELRGQPYIGVTRLLAIASNEIPKRIGSAPALRIVRWFETRLQPAKASVECFHRSLPFVRTRGFGRCCRPVAVRINVRRTSLFGTSPLDLEYRAAVWTSCGLRISRADREFYGVGAVIAVELIGFHRGTHLDGPFLGATGQPRKRRPSLTITRYHGGAIHALSRQLRMERRGSLSFG